MRGQHWDDEKNSNRSNYYIGGCPYFPILFRGKKGKIHSSGKFHAHTAADR